VATTVDSEAISSIKPAPALDLPLAAVRPAVPLPPVHAAGRRWLRVAATLGITAIVAAAAPGLLTRRVGARPSPTPLALAVLPFQNLSDDPEQEYFSEGFTDELIAQVGRLAPDQLRVIARQSTMRYRRSDKGSSQIARELGVDYEGRRSVRTGPRARRARGTSPGHLRLATQLRPGLRQWRTEP
jgi:hypothetical protein